MTSYPGPWIQAPDYDRDGIGAIAPDTIPVETLEVVYEDNMDERVPWTAEQVTSRLLNSENRARGAFSGNVEQGHVEAQVDYFVDPAHAFKNARRLTIRRAWVVRSISAESLGVRNWAPSPPDLAVPPGVIGWEWQDGSPANEVNRSGIVTLEADIVPTPTTNSFDGSVGEPVADPFISPVTVDTGDFLSDAIDVGNSDVDQITGWDGPSGVGAPVIQLAGPIAEPAPGTELTRYGVDLTPHLDVAGRVVLSASPSFAIAAPIPPADLSVNGVIDYGVDFTIVPRWTFRPPVFRWLYATPQITSAPPLRHTQRDDRHGPSPRNRPARSRQAGHRNTGYL